MHCHRHTKAGTHDCATYLLGGVICVAGRAADDCKGSADLGRSRIGASELATGAFAAATSPDTLCRACRMGLGSVVRLLGARARTALLGRGCEGG